MTAGTVTVRDDGEGVHGLDGERIFAAYYRAAGVDAKPDSIGLVLSVAQLASPPSADTSISILSPPYSTGLVMRFRRICRVRHGQLVEHGDGGSRRHRDEQDTTRLMAMEL